MLVGASQPIPDAICRQSGARREANGALCQRTAVTFPHKITDLILLLWDLDCGGVWDRWRHSLQHEVS